ncbi:monovalent cation/H+ antiporter complex subunit F [Actinomyces sp. B33]|uniref:monovalent cation/H+ antiporter complex subunit F n=1 Tax=Actinomyces sp. B33 TaxID=2942131 RepID=UPI00233F945F|nr:monovalent cation/H+ antiporter complex subunit F [Actinomyces sp. B33]MDC4233469.1 monovalent cation/H+ antiporter complex subunit F [Actinomyces sp. B33]
MSALDLVHLAAACLAACSAILALVRIGRGPSLLDRAIANDVLTASGIALLAVMIVGWNRADLGVVIFLLALIGFLAPVVIARFTRREHVSERRILTAEEAAEQMRAREDDARRAEEAEAQAAEAEAAREIAETAAMEELSHVRRTAPAAIPPMADPGRAPGDGTSPGGGTPHE